MMYTSAAIILLTTLAYGLVHSLLASLRAKDLARRWLGSQADRYYRLAYNLFGVASFLPVVGLVAWLPDQKLYAVPWPWAAVCLAGQAGAVLTLVAGVRQTGVDSFLGLRQLVTPGEETPRELVVRGLYRWVRHPLYTAGLALIWLSPIMTANLLALNLGLTIYIVIGARVEERKLQREFGPAYELYRARTPFLIPGWRARP